MVAPIRDSTSAGHPPLDGSPRSTLHVKQSRPDDSSAISGAPRELTWRSGGERLAYVSEYKEHLQEDEALARSFRPVYVAAPTTEETRHILITSGQGLRRRSVGAGRCRRRRHRRPCSR